MKRTMSRNNRLIALFVVLALAITAVCCAFVAVKPVEATTQMSGTSNETMEEYEIYPIPHSVEYASGTTAITSVVKASYGEIDEVTKNHVSDAFYAIDKIVGTTVTSNGTQVLVGIYDSGDVADEFVKQNAAVASEHYQKTDAYVLVIKSGTIAVVGRDTDSAYYGVTTLAMILEQTDGSSVRNLIVADYSDGTYRGFIEGYYGVPWTTDERIELMRFGSKFKTNMYIYAPKDDPYHSTNWRGLYSGADLAALKEQVEAGTQTKTRFVWAVHPFMYDKMTEQNYEKDLQDLLNKFEQLYSAGVRQFFISADDVATDDLPNADGTDSIYNKLLDGSLHTKLLNDVVEWLDEKGDCYNLLFVPSAYCYNSAEALRINLDYYFETLLDGRYGKLDDSVEILWTGDKVCSTVSDGRFKEFYDFTDGRKAFMWLNWPVTDYDPTYLLCGKGQMLDVTPSSGNVDFSGIVTNPMQFAEPSKISIFAIADYCWNVGAFDADSSYTACFKYIDDGEPQALQVICEQISSTASRYDGMWLEESEYIKPYIERFEKAFDSSIGFDEAAVNLKNQFDIIISAVYNYSHYSTNEAMRNTIQPWANALSILSQSAQRYIDLVLTVRKGDYDATTVKAKYDAINEYYATIKDCKGIVLDTATRNNVLKTVSVGARVLMPFMENLQYIVTEEVAIPLGLSTGISAKGMGSIYYGELDDILDGDGSSYVWFGGYPVDGAYVRIDLDELTSISKLRIINSKPDGGDVMLGIVECSTDGKMWTEIGKLSNGGDTVISLNSAVNARYIRLKAVGNSTWTAISEVYINTLNGLNSLVDFSGISLESVSPAITSITDGNIETFAWFTSPDEGSCIIVDYLENKTINNVQLLMAKPSSMDDYLRKGKIEYSTDGVTWQTLCTFENTRNVRYSLEQAITARYVRVVATEASAFGLVVRDFSINNDYAVSVGNGFKLYENGVRGDNPITHEYYAADGNSNTFMDLEVVEGGERTVTLDLKSVSAVSDFSIVSGGIDWADNITSCKIEYSTDGTTFIALGENNGEYANPDGTYAIELGSAVSARYIRVTVLNSGWITVREMSVTTA